MKRIIITLICILMTLSLYAANNSIFEGSTPDSASDTPTQTIELTIGDELYKYSVGFSTDGSKPSKDISENTKLELSSDDKTIAVNTSELYVWWDIMTADAFDVTYSFVPHEMRYFYRLANPILCVLSGSLTFFQVSELRKLNSNNPDMKDALIFAATENDYRVFSTRDKKVYVGVDKEDGSGIAFTKCLADSFDLYIQNMIDQGDILNGPIASESDSNNRDEDNDSNKE